MADHDSIQVDPPQWSRMMSESQNAQDTNRQSIPMSTSSTARPSSSMSTPSSASPPALAPAPAPASLARTPTARGPKSFPITTRTPMIVDTETLIEKRPTSPALWFGDGSGKVLALPICDLQMHAHFHVSTAVVRVTLVFQNTASSIVDALFLLPLKGTVTGARVKIGADRNMLTSVIPTSDVDTLPKKKVADMSIPIIDPFEKYVPDLFRLPLTGIRKGEQVLIDVDYIEPCSFIDGKYVCTFPLNVAASLLPLNIPISECVRIHASVYSVLDSLSVSSPTHSLQVVKSDSRLDIVASMNDEAKSCVDFTIAYSLLSSSILATCITEKHNVLAIDEGADKSEITPEGKEDGSFLLFVTPPNKDHIPQTFARDIVFLFDRSGSMVGEPFEEAVRGLDAALSMLKPQDKFTVVAFDDEMMKWSDGLKEATPDHIADAVTWIRRLPPDRGATDIRTPLQWALGLLNPILSKDGTGVEGAPSKQSTSLPFVFLLTDGCVEDERAICEYANSHVASTRILTFGIGTFCNWYFLRMLAEIGRGTNQNAIYRENIYEKITLIFSQTQAPLLSNITISLPGVESTDMIPNPVPDLYANCPLMIAGKYRSDGTFPKKIILRGVQADGERIELEIDSKFNPSIPVRKVFLKQRIDALTARCWLSESKELESEIIQLSCDQSMPCAYTTMVAYEVSKSDYEKNKKSKKKVNARAIAAVAIGGAVVLGVAMVVFGDIGASLSNLPIGSALHFVGGGCCGCCGSCMSTLCSPCTALIHCLGSCIGSIFSLCHCSSCCECLASTCEHAVKCIGCC